MGDAHEQRLVVAARALDQREPGIEFECVVNHVDDFNGQVVEGRSSDQWVDFDFYGHQIVAHLSDEGITNATNQVDGDNVPVRHFGVVLNMNEWRDIAQRLKDAGTKFIVEPRVRFAGQAGEQATLFVLDPSGNALEFKAFGDADRLFEK